uniref:Uncharacterized protein n=1 Tax=Arundo donax TaxID=35708 RepID=A0A0A8YLP8_ARUDO
MIRKRVLVWTRRIATGRPNLTCEESGKSDLEERGN